MPLPKCPKCGSSTYTINESMEEVVIYPVRDGVLSNEAVDHWPGGSIDLMCECGCGHMWRPRRIKSISDARDLSA